MKVTDTSYKLAPARDIVRGEIGVLGKSNLPIKGQHLNTIVNAWLKGHTTVDALNTTINLNQYGK